MTRRRFTHSNNPSFTSSDGVLLIPFGRESYLPAIVERYGGEAVPMDETTDRIVYQLTATPEPVTLVYTGMGSPAVANGLEMIAADGGRRVVVFGACGGAVPEVAVGDLIVVEEAVRGEGTSRYYAREDRAACCDLDLIDALWTSVQGNGYETAHRGKVYTTDAGYRQGPEVYDGRHGRVLGVECECSAAAIVAQELGLELGAILFVTDNVTRAEKEDQSYRGLQDSRVRAAFESGLATAVRSLQLNRTFDP